jgi:hypothetical protein
MRYVLSAGLAAVLATAIGGAALAETGPQTTRTPVGDRDDQIIITGCVMRGIENNTQGPRSMLVWSKGDVYLETATTEFKSSDTIDKAIGTGGVHAPVFYWIDDEDDFGKYLGSQVEIVGELNDRLKKGDVELRKKGAFTEIAFDAGGREAKARVPSQWLAPDTPNKNARFEVIVRTVDVENVTPLGPCAH